MADDPFDRLTTQRRNREEVDTLREEAVHLRHLIRELTEHVCSLTEENRKLRHQLRHPAR